MHCRRLIPLLYIFSIQAIQDITRTYDIPPEDIVTLIYEKIDVHGEGEEHQIGGSCQTVLWCLTPQHGTQLNTVFNLLFVGRRADAGGVHQRGQGASRHHGDAHQDDGSHPRPGNHRQRAAEESHKLSSGHVWAGRGAGRRVWAQRMESRVPSNTATPRTVLYLTEGPCARLTLAPKEAEEPCSAVCLSSYSSGYFH